METIKFSDDELKKIIAQLKLYSKDFEMQQGADEDESRSIYIICEQRIKYATQLLHAPSV